MTAPQNQASPLFSVVPVLPHCPEAPMLAWVPVPLLTTVSRMLFACEATLFGITCVWVGSLSPPLIVCPFWSVTFV